MDIIVPVRMVPDPVEELEPDPAGTDIDREWIEFVVSEFDDHAIEEAILAKEADDAVTITVAALDDGLADVDQMLYRAAAMDVDRLVKITDVEPGLSTSEVASLYAGFLEDEQFDAVFTGVQSAEDRDGQLAGTLAGALDLPHLSVITRVEANGDSVLVEKEFGGGVTADYEVSFPAILGIQAAQEPPRYVAVSQIRRAMRGAEIEEIPAAELDIGTGPGSTITTLHEPETGEEAEIIGGSPDDAAASIVEVLTDHGLGV